MRTCTPRRLSLFVVTLMAILLTACKPSTPGATATADQELWRRHVSDYTQGWVSNQATLIVNFSHPVVSDAQLNTPMSGIVTLTPSQEVVAVFTATDVLELRHPEPLPAGATLALSLSAERLQDIPPALAPLTWQLRVIEQNFSVREIGLVDDETVAGDDTMQLVGMVETSDAVDVKAIEQILDANQLGRELGIAWQHQDERNHQFTVLDIRRESSVSQVLIRWDGERINVNNRGERSVSVPAISQFDLISTRAISEPETFVELRFSQPLDGRQNLAGLIRVNGVDARTQLNGAVLRVYPPNGESVALQGEQRLQIDAAIRSSDGKTLPQSLERSISFAAAMPAVRFADTGNILPPATRLTLPIEAVGVSAVQLRAFEIFPDNIGQYLQSGSIAYSTQGNSYDYNQRAVGRYLWQKTLQLPELPHNTWQRFEMDVSELVASKKGSLIRLELQILPQHSLYPCDAPLAASADEKIDVRSLNFEGSEKSDTIPASLRRYYESQGYYDWRAQRNPCSESYYSPYFDHAHVSQLFFASNIGLLAKQGDDNTLHVVTTNLTTAQPLPDTDVEVFNFQQQLIGSGKTDAEGLLSLQLQGVPFSVRAANGSDVNYLRVPRNAALPTSQFNTGGEVASQGVKGFIYGERDIWRPGDDIYLTFVLMDRNKALPDDYPLTLEFFDPRGGKADSITNTDPVNGFYRFALKTAGDAPTGNWRAIVKVGDNYFDEVIKIENVVPNRLGIELALPEEGIHPEQVPLLVTLHSQWLTGATAARLKADLQLSMSAAKTSFSGYESYVFDDKARRFTSSPQNLFEGNLDENGDATITVNPTIDTPPPGRLALTFTQRVFEPGGQFSTQYRSVSLYPYSTWVGVKLPAGNANYYGSLDKDTDHAIDILTVDSHGQPIANHNLTVALYALEWRWWWDEREANYAQYISSSTRQLKETASITTDTEGRAQWILNGPRHEWGQYLVRVCDAEEGGINQHCSSNELYLGWGYSGNTNRDAATRMALTSDQEKYNVGQTASIHLPEGPDRRVLVSIENSSRVLQRYWQDVAADSNSFPLRITEDMSPNAYVHVTQLQPHAGRNNDLPIRLYGILPLAVDDPATHLYPVISAPEKTRPESTLSVGVTERDGRAMTYTLALVDEGLLGITGYSTPDPHDSLYRREALGVLTWDMFDQVVGAYSAELSRLLSVGGSDSTKVRDTGRERRFPPVVRFMGPFELAAGARGEHSIALPQYMGAVRVMVVAGDGHAYGRAEHGVSVTQPLTLLTTLPRVLGPGEELDVPVNLFVSEAPFGTANVQITADDFFDITTATASANFSSVGEQLTHLGLKVNDKVGTAEIAVRAALGNETAQEVIHIPVRSANAPTTVTQVQVIQPGATWTPDLQLQGMLGTNDTTLTVSSMPELKLEERLQYLIHYPHGCIEQTTSAVFPQLYLSLLTDVSGQQAADIERNINAAIARLASFQTSSGGFAYWPYLNDVDPWGNNYAGHFLLEARERGYAVPAAMLNKWIDYQRTHLNDFNSGSYEADAYRVYTLALAGKADTGAMNRLRERFLLDQNRSVSLLLLALAYQQIGQDAVSNDLMARAARAPAASSEWTYGSTLRDNAVLLLLRHKRGLLDDAWQTAGLLARDLSSDTWYSTQSTAWALMSLAQAFGQREENTAFALQTSADDSDWQAFSITKAIYRQPHLAYQPGGITLRNDSAHPVYAALSNRGIPAATQEQARSNGLQIATRFTTTDGQPLDVSSLRSGTDFIAEVTVTNTSNRELTNIALTQVVPSGWQIRNSRLEGSAENPAIDYQDIGDDRLISYFSLSATPSARSNYYWWRNNRSMSQQVTVRLVLNASFAGKFYLPGWAAEPMYDGSFNATTEGQWVEVVQ